MYRCIPWSDANKTVVLTCTDSAGSTVALDDPKCTNIMESVTTTQQKPKVDLPIVDKLQGFATTFSMYISDVVQTWYLIVGVGGGCAVILGFVWLVLMKMFAGIIV
eukprot:SAG31_NODE_24890_length_472_cov_1.241287_1_plen_105_part_01